MSKQPLGTLEVTYDNRKIKASFRAIIKKGEYIQPNNYLKNSISKSEGLFSKRGTNSRQTEKFSYRGARDNQFS